MDAVSAGHGPNVFSNKLPGQSDDFLLGDADIIRLNHGSIRRHALPPPAALQPLGGGHRCAISARRAWREGKRGGKRGAAGFETKEGAPKGALLFFSNIRSFDGGRTRART